MKIVEQIGKYRLGMDLHSQSQHSFVCLEDSTRPRIIKGYYDITSGWMDYPHMCEFMGLEISLKPTAESRFERDISALRHIAQHEPTRRSAPELLHTGIEETDYLKRQGISKLHYAVMEHIDGENLFQNLPIWLNTFAGMPVDGCFNLVMPTPYDLSKERYLKETIALIDVIGMVKEFHNIGLTWGDIKPGNILLKARDPKAIDFEYSNIKGFEYKSRFAAGQTPYYSETCPTTREPANTSYDLYSIGCLIDDLFPFNASSQDLAEFVHGLYRYLDFFNGPVGIANRNEIISLAHNHPDEFKNIIRKEPEKGLWLLQQYDNMSGNKLIDFGIRDINQASIERDKRYFLMQHYLQTPLFEALNQIIRSAPIIEIQNLGKSIVTTVAEKRMSASELHDKLI
ncbi:MAG: hypothetical protein ABIJ08_03155, partial [Nanoarchaeota archaeon]